MKMTQKSKNQTKIKKNYDALPANAQPIPNYPTYYATPNGDIWRVCPARKQPFPFKQKPERIIKLNTLSNVKYKYVQCQPYVNGKRKLAYVHTLVCLAFNGLPPTDKHEVNHIDYDKTNNHKDNLEWVTRSENVQHSVCNRVYHYKYDYDYLIEQLEKGVSVNSMTRELQCSVNYIYTTLYKNGLSMKQIKKTITENSNS